MAETPRRREKNVTGSGNGVHKRGEGLGTGPVGSGSGMGNGSGSGGPQRSGGGGRLGLIIAVVVMLLGGGGGLGAFLGGGSSSDGGSTGGDLISTVAQSALSGGLGNGALNQLSGISSSWGEDANTGKLNNEVAAEARARYTEILGDGKDTVTIMVYMCGTDLESKYGMATNDLKEMSDATLSDQVNIIAYTGGCRQWKTNGISNSTNQIWQVKKGGMNLLEENMGNGAMTDPANLTTFIKYCAENYPANRQMLIFWDHGGGSLSGYGYDETHASSGSMTLSGIQSALKNAGEKFDFIGFDACLMATVETDLMISNYADYIIASEETEPGVGWYYTNWLTDLSGNTSMPTIEIGKKIIDDFVDVCDRSCRGQKTTLSIVDLAELSQTLPDDFKAFSQSTSGLIAQKQYNVVSDARVSSREFAQSSHIDQIDLVNFAKNLNTEEGNALAQTLLSAVKYNRTSSNMTNAYGVSVYFPYQKTSSVSKASKIYEDIGVDTEYSDCIREFAGMQGAGQAAGGMSSPVSMLGGGSADGMQSLEAILSLVSGLSTSGRSISDEDAADFVFENQLDASKLVWQDNGKGDKVISIPADQWALVHDLNLNLFVDDGEGYIDMGLDNLFDVDENGNLVADLSGTWVSINDQPVAYYHTDTVEEDGDAYTVTGYVPAMLNGERVKLILIYDDENPWGYIAGADLNYDPSVTETQARGLVELQPGDTLEFLCDYYAYDGSYLDSYYLGEPMTVTEDMKISDTLLDSKCLVMYKFTDIYNNNYWSERLTID
ncbi:MAG: peptidase C11 [Lachnospiraceae bacterium]|nr:peptidase C11 [Lachnospiraceae bacterium]